MTRDDDRVERLKLQRDQYARSVSELTARFDEKIEELSFVRQLGDALGSTLDLAVLCQDTVDIVLEALGPENCSILLLDEQVLYLVAARGAYDEQASVYGPGDQRPMFKLGEGIAGHSAQSQAILRVDDTLADPRFSSVADARVEARSVLCAPLQSGGKVLGVINLSDSLPNAFEDRHERMLALMCNGAAMALENAMLFSEVEASRQQLATENQQLRKQLSDRFSVDGLIGNSPSFQRVLKLVEKVADSTANILVTGESGTGKEVIARTIHFSSARRDKPFIAINCGALPETLLEAELFGIEKGIATGVDARVGTFEKAQGGTLFLDEIGDMPHALQVRLLRVLQERQLTRVGSQELISIDVRIVSATHRDLIERIEAGSFREDLYYRLKVIEVQLPALRDRREDILQLAHHFIEIFSDRHRRPRRSLSQGAVRALMQHRWSGNVRELEHTLEQAVLLAEEDKILPSDLGLLESNESGYHLELPEGCSDFHVALAQVQELAEAQLIRRALHETQGNRTQAAVRLGIARRTLNYKLVKYGLD